MYASEHRPEGRRQTETETALRTTALLAAARGGDQRAWSRLVARYDGLVRSVVRIFPLDAASAEDVVQCTWCRLVEHAGQVREPERLGAWLCSTARHECYRALRRASREAPYEEQALHALVGGEPAAEEDELLDAASARRVMQAFRTLKADQQQLLELVLVAEPRPSYEEIGAALGRPVGSIGPTLGRCLQKLRVALTTLS